MAEWALPESAQFVLQSFVGTLHGRASLQGEMPKLGQVNVERTSVTPVGIVGELATPRSRFREHPATENRP